MEFQITPDYVHPMKKETGESAPLLIRKNDTMFPSLPFPMEDMARALDRQESPHKTSSSDNLVNMWAMEGMGRSVILAGGFEFEASDHTKFFFVSIKGIGFTDAYISRQIRGTTFGGIKSIHTIDLEEAKKAGQSFMKSPHDDHVDKISGASALESLETDWQNSLRLHRAGIRTSLPIVLFETQMGGREARAFRNYERISELRYSLFLAIGENESIWKRDTNRARTLIENSKTLLSRERQFGEIKSDKDYLLLFAKLLGKQVGIMQRIGYLHRDEDNAGGLDIMHNLTLSAEIVDHDTGVFTNRIGKRQQGLLINQYLTALSCLATLTEVLIELNGNETSLGLTRKQIVESYSQEYLKNASLLDRIYTRSRLQEVLNPDKYLFEMEENNPLFCCGKKSYAQDLEIFLRSKLEGLSHKADAWKDEVTEFWLKRKFINTALAR